MIYKSRKRICEPVHRRRQHVYHGVVKPKSEAERRAALKTALAEIEAKYGLNAIKRGSDCHAD